MRSYERLRVKKRDRGRHCLFRHGAFLAARVPLFDRMTQMAVRRKPIVPFYGGCQDHWRLTSDADLVSEGSARLHRACYCFDRSYGAQLRW
jgi:hypothetical protein